MKFTKRWLVLMMAVLVAVMAGLCSCSPAQDTSSTETSTEEESSTEETSEETDITPDVIDLGGREVNVLCTDWTSSITSYSGEIIITDSESSSSIVDTAKKAVIDWVESEYNCVIGGDLTYDVAGTVTTMVTSGTYSYDIVFASGATMCSMITNGMLTDLNTVSSIHLTNSWWDQNCVRDCSLANKLYFVCGDINTFDNIGTWVMLFNKTLQKELNITEDFYQTVKDGNWTLDHFMEICKGITYDSNGDGTVNEFDTWAFGTETYNIYVTAVAGGIKIAEKDQDDLPTLSIETNAEQTYNLLDKVVSFYNSGDVMVANGGKYSQYSNPWESTVLKSFIEGRELFYEAGLLHIATFRSMDDEIGILPVPKSFESQDGYSTTVSTGNASFMALPYGVPDVEELGTVVEAIAMKSQEFVTPEFYETQLKYREFHDDESAEMLDIIFASRSFDIGAMFNWGSLLSCYMSQDTNYASRFESVLSAAKSAMQSTLEDLQ